MTGEVVEIHLAPTLANGDVVILDNLPEHRSERAERSTRFGAPSSTSMVWSSPKNIRTTSLPQDMDSSECPLLGFIAARAEPPIVSV
jgi:hypothetical protein